MQWMTMGAYVPNYALHAPQHVAEIAICPLNQLMVSFAHSAETPVFTRKGRHTQRFDWLISEVDHLTPSPKGRANSYPHLSFAR